MRSELANRMIGKGTNALASSIVLVCRRRPDDAPLATRREFLTALRAELPQALRLLQTGNIAPVDLAQAAIGPGMAVYTRYAPLRCGRRSNGFRPSRSRSYRQESPGVRGMRAWRDRSHLVRTNGSIRRRSPLTVRRWRRGRGRFLEQIIETCEHPYRCQLRVALRDTGSGVSPAVGGPS